MAKPNNASRAYSAAHFLLELGEKEVVGFPRSVEGGNLKAEIMTYQAGNSHGIWRQLSTPKIDDLKIQVGLSMADVFYDWLEGFFNGDVVRKHGALLAGDFHYNERARRSFYDALISAVDFPKLDGSDKSACYMTVTLSPERMLFEKGSGKSLEATIGSMNQKLWTASNFLFRIDGFEDACKFVTQVDGFTIKQQIMEYPAGNMRQPLRVPGRIEWPNLTFYVPEANSKDFIEHFKKHVIDGELQKSPRMTGVIEYHDHKGAVMAELSLAGVDIAKIEHDKADAGGDDIKKVKIEISIESMSFDYKK